MSDRMGKKGYTEGDMSPVVENYAKPEKDFAERGFSKTTDYIGRKNSHESMAAKDIEKQHYKGRYS